MDYSFYGGRRGAAFVITGRFTSIAEMVTYFKQGSNYKVVNYDEYAIIDTVNKNDPDNGKLYRRGYNYQDVLGGAQYIGQIVGPAGVAPLLEMTTVEAVKAIEAQEGYDYRFSEGEYAPTKNLVPGKDGNKYNDSIKWACCSVRDELDKDTIAYIGFTFPYTVIDYTAQSVDPYYNRSASTENFVNQNLVTRTDDTKHPYYEKWNISVPKGIKGDAFKNFRVISAAANDGVSSYTGQSNDRAGKTNTTFSGEDKTRKIAVYDYYHYDKDGSGEPVSIYLGDYNVISNVAIDDDGTVRIAYSHDDDSVFINKIKWINSISLTQKGVFTVNYNYGGTSTRYQTTLTWIDNVSIEDDGTIKFKYNDGKTNDLVFDNVIQWITGVTLSKDGTLSIQYNNGTEDTVFNKQIQWIESITLDDNGLLTIKYNNGTPNFTKTLRWVKNISINTGTVEGTGNQKLHTTYNDGTSADIGNPLNYIMRTAITPNDYHLLILFSDPARRAEIVTNKQNYVYDNRNDWFDCGSIKNYNGILVGTNYDIDYFTDKSNEGIITQLNRELPNGFDINDVDRHGKMITVGINNLNKSFFGFDYNKDDNGKYIGWYYVGNFSEYPGAIAGKASDKITTEIANALPTNSVWFIVSSK